MEWGPKIHFTRLYSIEAILERVIVFRHVSVVFPVNYYHGNSIICVSDWVFTTGDDIITFYIMCHRHDNTIFLRQCDVRHCKDCIHDTFKTPSQYLETWCDNSLKIRCMPMLFKLWIIVKPSQEHFKNAYRVQHKHILNFFLLRILQPKSSVTNVDVSIQFQNWRV